MGPAYPDTADPATPAPEAARAIRHSALVQFLEQTNGVNPVRCSKNPAGATKQSSLATTVFPLAGGPETTMYGPARSFACM
jgi:hypothetical protein